MRATISKIIAGVKPFLVSLAFFTFSNPDNMNPFDSTSTPDDNKDTTLAVLNQTLKTAALTGLLLISVLEVNDKNQKNDSKATVIQGLPVRQRVNAAGKFLVVAYTVSLKTLETAFKTASKKAFELPAAGGFFVVFLDQTIRSFRPSKGETRDIVGGLLKAVATAGIAGSAVGIGMENQQVAQLSLLASSGACLVLGVKGLKGKKKDSDDEYHKLIEAPSVNNIT